MKQNNRLFASAFLAGGCLLLSVTVPAVQQNRAGKQQQLDLQLFRAVQEGQAASVKSLLNRGANPRGRTSNGYTPLQEAKFKLNNISLQIMMSSHPVGAPPSKERQERAHHMDEEFKRRQDIYMRLQQAKK